MRSSYNTPCSKYELFYSHNETSLAMSTLAIRCRVFQSRDVNLHNFDGLAMSGLAFSVAPHRLQNSIWLSTKERNSVYNSILKKIRVADFPSFPVFVLTRCAGQQNPLPPGYHHHIILKVVTEFASEKVILILPLPILFADYRGNWWKFQFVHRRPYA